MNVLTAHLNKARIFAVSSPPTRSDTPHDPIDVFTPSKESLSEAKESQPRSSVNRWAVWGMGAVTLLAGTLQATASTGPMMMQPESFRPSVEGVLERQIDSSSEIDVALERVEPEAPTPAPIERSYGQQLNDEQKIAIDKIVADLGEQGFKVKVDDVINFMATETGGTFDPAVRAGGQKNGAVGLAQFTQTAIDAMNLSRDKDDQLTKAKLEEMTFTEQSEVVTEYLASTLRDRGMEGKEVSGADLYAAVFAPVAVGKPMDASVYSSSRSNRYYRANRSLDTNRDGHITKGELTVRLEDWAEIGDNLRG